MAPPSEDLQLQCCACGRPETFDVHAHRCSDCGEALELSPPRLAGLASPPGPVSRWELAGALWRYRDFLPGVPAELVDGRVRCGAGGTPLLPAPELAERCGCRHVWLKDETRNPTGSFKDRGTAVAVAVLLSLGHDSIGTVSTGNMARSVAAYAARAGLRATVWVGAATPADKLAPVMIHGARLVRVDGPYGELYRCSLARGREVGVPFVNSDAALRIEGQKTLALEIVEQRRERLPDWVVVPTSSGGNLSAIARGFDEAVAAGWADRVPRLVAVQASGCDPIARAWSDGLDAPVERERARTVAGAISNPDPPSGGRALRWLRRCDGRALAVTDTEILEAQATLARRTGRFVQPAGAAGLAALERLAGDGLVDPDQEVVLVLTGNGSNAPAPEMPLPEPVRLDDVRGG